jgi:Tol biopolymer transport system component
MQVGRGVARALRGVMRRGRTVGIATIAVGLIGPAAVASAADYVALGDSYSSGTGTRSYYDTGCERSVYAYPYLIKGALGSTFTFSACGGAKTQDVLNNQVSALSSSTKFATISIGGNDAGFSSVITECAKPSLFSDCDGAINGAQSYINNTLPGRLDLVYDAIRSKAPNAVVAALTYPRLFNGEDCNAATFFSSGEETRLNQTADQLASVMRGRAQAHGFTFVDPRAAFVGHAVCDSTEWLNGLSNPTSESYHPNRLGHEAFSGMVKAALLAAPKPGAPVGGVGRIAFSSSRGGNDDVYVMNADGGFPVDITNDPASDVDPAWSPDGTKVAFASNRDGDNEIYVANGDGTGVTKLTSNTADDRDPAWSPNGDYLAFRSDRTGNNEIFRMTDTGGSQTNLTNNGASDFAPDWSPDGAEIAFQRFASGSGTGQGNEVFKANADGQGQSNLTNNSASVNDGRPAWAPNGSTIAFHSNRDGDFEIFTMSSSGTSVTQRTSNTALDQDPAYSPTGAQIAFQSNRDGNDEIYTMTSTGGSPTNRSKAAGSDTGSSWQADSTPPMTTLTAGPDGPTTNASPDFTFAASELGSTLQCRVDTGAYIACASPYRPLPLADGEHTFAVRAIDPAGNVDATPVSRTFVVDTTPPALAIQCPASVMLNGDGAAVVTASDALTGLPEGEDPSGTYALDTSVPGAQSFRLDAVDVAGNRTSGRCDYVVRYPDPGAPALSSGATPNAGAFALAWTPSAPAEYPLAYTLQRRDADDQDWSDVDTTLTEPTRAFSTGEPADEGTWTYRVKGVDATHGAETGWSPASEPVTVDESAPAFPTLRADRDPEYAGDGGWFRDSVTVTTAADGGDPVLRDGSAPSGVDPDSVAGPQTLTQTTTVTETVRDRAGNVSPPMILRVRADAHAPALQMSCPDSVLLFDDAVATVTASDDESGLAEDPSGTMALDTTHAGPQVVERTAIDHVGHARTERCTVDVRYPAPGVPAVTDGGNPNAGAFTLGWTRSAPASYPLRYEVQRRDADDAFWQDVQVGIDGDTLAIESADAADEGTWTYRVKGIDGDLETPWSAPSAPVTVDRTASAAPSVTADRDPDYAGDGGWYRDAVTVATADAGDPVLRDGSAPSGVDPASVAGPAILTEPATVARTVRDRVGHVSSATELAVQVDSHAPALQLECPPSVLLHGTASVTVTAADGESGLASDPTGVIPMDTSHVGTQVIERTATDHVGHARTERCEVPVRYGYSGLLQPVNPDGSSVFKLGSTVPLKMDLADAGGTAVTAAVASVELAKVSTTVEGTSVEEVVNATPTNGKAFIYNGGHYQYNLATKPLSVGTWQIRVVLDDGAVHRTTISLR